jgi:hypothetical protein
MSEQTKEQTSTNAEGTTSNQPIAKPHVGCSLSDVSENAMPSDYNKRYPNSFRERFSQKELDECLASYSLVKIDHDYYELSLPQDGCSIRVLLTNNIASAYLYTKFASQVLFNEIRITDIGNFAFLFEKNITISLLASRKK